MYSYNKLQWHKLNDANGIGTWYQSLRENDNFHFVLIIWVKMCHGLEVLVYKKENYYEILWWPQQQGRNIVHWWLVLCVPIILVPNFGKQLSNFYILSHLREFMWLQRWQHSQHLHNKDIASSSAVGLWQQHFYSTRRKIIVCGISRMIFPTWYVYKCSGS